jgi:hypothetical protein
VHRFTRDNCVFFEFHPYHFLVKDSTTRIPLLHCRCVGGLYPLMMHGAPMSLEALLSAHPSTDLWHMRLGHLGSFSFRQIVNQHKLLNGPSNNAAYVYSTCQMAKSHQLLFLVSNNKSSAPLQLMHTDVWGPAIRSSGAFRYYVSFVDDFSRFSYIYMLWFKSDVHRVFLDFQAHVECLLGRKILSVQSDWVGEYLHLNSYLKSIGIQHRVSCPHTHQQNGVADQKHCNIMETSLALLAHSSLPLRFWDDAFVTACYLINHLPSKVVDSVSLFEKLLNKQPSYDQLRVFGSSCWPNLRPYNSTKLSFRSMPCVFLGYHSMHKGYKCLPVLTGRVYLSRDTVFDEHKFPFAHSQYSSPAPISERYNFLRAIVILFNPFYAIEAHMSVTKVNPHVSERPVAYKGSQFFAMALKELSISKTILLPMLRPKPRTPPDQHV